ncbi:hypothetical protein M8J75_004273 [Diaphorina citri]|nr:hypothetical protein M8J75_004273 [Diaphorina citri]
MDSSISQNFTSGPAPSTLPAPSTQLTSLTPPVPSHTTPLKRTATQIRNRRRRAAKIRDPCSLLISLSASRDAPRASYRGAAYSHGPVTPPARPQAGFP